MLTGLEAADAIVSAADEIKELRRANRELAGTNCKMRELVRQKCLETCSGRLAVKGENGVCLVGFHAGDSCTPAPCPLLIIQI